MVLAACSPSGGQEKGGDKKGGGPAGGHGGGMPPPEVTVVTVEPKALPVSFEYVGQTAGSREAEVRSRIQGILVSKNFREGESVKKGQSLYTIDPAPFEAALARAAADVAAAEARHEQAKRNAARLKPLYAEKAVSQKEYDDAASAEAIAVADVKAAQARLTEARLNLAYTKVESPISGLASRSIPSEGSLIPGPQQLLTTVVDVDPIWVNFGIPDNEQAKLQKDVEQGKLNIPKTFEVEVRLADGTVHDKKGRMNFSDVRVSAQTGTREARAELPNADGRLRPGQFVRVVLKGATIPNAVTVPQRAVLQNPQGGGKIVFVVDEKSTAQPRPVEAGEWSGDQWVITSGLKAGERVIVDGVMKLGPGAPVRIAEPKPAAKK
ncbi:MAG TPA: efflux RND transporter periplasmic adaptor subunit [Terriglobales bacterium]|nr:efflux RND transporter periplasmic adaptor subunit [Terriglobales bacterium]